MSEFTQGSSIDLFSVPGTSGANSFKSSGISRSVDSDTTFSRDFSRAKEKFDVSERVTNSEKNSQARTSDRTKPYGTDAQQKDGNSTEQVRGAGNTGRVGSAEDKNQSNRRAHENSDSTQRVDKVEENSDVNPSKLQDTKNADAGNTVQSLGEGDAPNGDVNPDKSENSDTHVNASLLMAGETNENIDNAGAIVIDNNTESESEIAVVTTASTNPDIRDNATDENLTVIAAPDATNMSTSGTKQLPEEQTSLELLARRKTQMLNTVVQRTTAPTAQDSLPKTVELDVDDVVASSKQISGSTMSLIQEDGKKHLGSRSGLDAKSEVVGVDKSMLSATDIKNASLTLNARQVNNADVQQNELQNAAIRESSNLSAKAELKQLQVNQMKAMQLELHAMQNSGSTPLVVNTDTTIADKPVTDNMFLSMRGGIVTAPVLNRPETGSNVNINAPINTPILQQDADKAMAANIRWMSSEGVKNAVVNVTPSGMGPISVSVGVENDQMTVSIVASQNATRDALDSLLPRLREQLIAQGNDGVRIDISDGKSENSSNGFGKQDMSGNSEPDGSAQAQRNANNAERSNEKELNGQSDRPQLSEGIATINDIRRGNRQFDIYV